MSLPTPPPSSIASLLPAALRGKTPKKLDSIYLDTTYLAPSYCFPAQELVISACADLVKERVVEGREEALWRADGREGERKGIKGWLKGTGGEVKEEGDEVKGEEDNEEMMAVEMLDGLPEENEDEGDGLGGEETMALEGEADMSNEYDGEDDGEEWKMIREMESQAQTPREGTIEPTGYFETGDFRGGDESQGLEEVPTLPEEQAEQDLEFQLDNAVKPEEKMEEDSKVELKPKVERDDEEEAEVKPVLEGDDSKPELKVDIKDEKLELKPKTERLLVMIGTYSIGKERSVSLIHSIVEEVHLPISCVQYRESDCPRTLDEDLCGPSQERTLSRARRPRPSFPHHGRPARSASPRWMALEYCEGSHVGVPRKVQGSALSRWIQQDDRTSTHW